MPPINSAYDKVTVFSPTGDAVTVSRLNAIDLIRTAGYGWRNTTVSATEAPEPEVVPVPDEEPVPHAVVAQPYEPEAAKPVAIERPAAAPAEDAPATSLEAEAKAVADFDSLADYLNTFDQAALRVMLEEKFGEKVHGRTSKEKVIEKIIAANDEQGGTAF